MGILLGNCCMFTKKLVMVQRCFFAAFTILLLFARAEAQTGQLAAGDTLPSFTLKDQDGHDFAISEQIGKQIMVIYFYPKDESPVCTREACSFRDSYADFTKAGALVIGINSGTVESHKSFAENHQLPFILLSDPDNKVLKLFRVKGKFGFTGRATFVVDLKGKIVYSYTAFTKGSAHAEKTLAFINEMKKN